MTANTRNRLSILEAFVATCIGLACGGMLQLASVPFTLLLPLMFCLTFLQDTGVIASFPLDPRGIIPLLNYLWYALCVAVAFAVMDGSRIVDPTAAGNVPRYWRMCWRHASWISKTATLIIITLICICLTWPLVEGYQLAPYSRAGANVTYDFDEDLDGATRILNVDFSGTTVDDNDLRRLKPNFDASEPFRLDLSGTGVTDVGIDALSKNRKLVSLKLDDTAITDTAITKLAECTLLQKLSLNRTGITDNAMTSVAGLVALQDLQLISTQASDAAVLSLQRISSLRKLAIGISTGEQTIEQLQESRPNLQIYRVLSADTSETPPEHNNSGGQYWLVMSFGLALVLMLGLGPFYLAYRDITKQNPK